MIKGSLREMRLFATEKQFKELVMPAIEGKGYRERMVAYDFFLAACKHTLMTEDEIDLFRLSVLAGIRDERRRLGLR